MTLLQQKIRFGQLRQDTFMSSHSLSLCPFQNEGSVIAYKTLHCVRKRIIF